MPQKVSAVTLSLAMLEESQNHSGPPLLLALGGDVNIKDTEHNLLLDGLRNKDREAGSIFWSKSLPPPAE
jgi:hypothetical protein